MRLLRRGCLTLVLLIGIVALGAVSLTLPYAGFQDDVYIDIPKGTGTRGIAGMLVEQGVIRYDWQFLLARAVRPTTVLKAGEYRFSRPASVWDVFGRIARGDVFYYELSIPEGFNIFDAAKAVADLKLISEEQFLAAVRSPSLIRDLAPKAPSLEGYLFPSTYRLTKHTTAEQLCKQMTDQFRKVWKELAAPPETDVHALVTLASLVEKESAAPAERPLVASVYANRLRIGMKLDCDPTTIYAALLENRYRGKIYRSDLQNTNAYNTYRHAGLPPGPIANPGRGSLKAALSPAESEYIFFVAKPDGSGEHQFSSDVGAHNKAVANYRRNGQ